MSLAWRLLRFIERTGFTVRRLPDRVNPYQDISFMVEKQRCPILFDVGSNDGQTILEMRRHIPRSIIHAFEPSPTTFQRLSNRYGGVAHVTLNNCGLGARNENAIFIENVHSEMSSFLEPGPQGWGEVTNKISVPVRTVDSYCADNGIEHIALLKVDTQGSELSVIEGAREMLARQRVDVIYAEVIFSKMYHNIARFDAFYGFLADRKYGLVGIYDQHRRGRSDWLLAWADVVFAREGHV
jgi:FkbM family methyltransferase